MNLQTAVDAVSSPASTNGEPGVLPPVAALPASPSSLPRGEGGRGPLITEWEYHLQAWTFHGGQARCVATAVRTLWGWQVPTGFTRVEQPLPSGDVRISRRRSWLTADNEADARRLLAYVAAGRAA